MMNKKNQFVILLDNIRSAQNVGTIIRTAEAAGVNKIYLSGITPDTNNSQVLKTSLGAENSIEILSVNSTFELIQKLKIGGMTIISLELSERAENYNNSEYHFPICLVLGNEVSGITNEVLEISDKIIEIPMRGKKNSLNVAVAAGVAIYEIANKRIKSS